MKRDLCKAVQNEFLEYWNTPKSVWTICQRFSCLLHERNPKIWKKLNSDDGFLSYLQNSAANSAHLAAHFCPALVCPQKAYCIFLESPHQVDMKNVVKCYKHFFCYFNALKTHCDLIHSTHRYIFVYDKTHKQFSKLSHCIIK